jgi:hypothetical protein
MAAIRRSLPHLKSNTAVTFSVSQSIRWESDPADFAVRLDYGDLPEGLVFFAISGIGRFGEIVQ